MNLVDIDKLGVGRCSKDVLPAAYCAGWNGLLGLLEKAPTVDAVPVVRCEGCVFSQSDGWVCGGTSLMPQHRTFPNSFCSDGERKNKNDKETNDRQD
jgi:hypothetical protein